MNNLRKLFKIKAILEHTLEEWKECKPAFKGEQIKNYAESIDKQILEVEECIEFMSDLLAIGADSEG